MFPVIALLLFSSAAAASPSPEKLIFILAGQSNMAGRGGVTGDRWDRIVPPACRPRRGILRFNARLRWEKAREPLHADIDTRKSCGIGPGMPFAHAVAAAFGGGGKSAVPAIGLVPCAVGGTEIREWARGTQLYNRMVRRARAASAGGKIAAALWYQGESDTVFEADAEAYGARMERVVSDLRSDLGDPDLLVIQVALASGEGRYTDLVREAQMGIKINNVLCVDAKGLQLEPGNLHLTSQAQVKLGSMLAAAYLNHTRCGAHLIGDL